MAEGLPIAIGRYAVEGRLGQGAMGVIYRGYDPALDRAVAIKLVRADLMSDEGRGEYVERFRREARAAGRCSHPNIVGVFDYGLHEENPYLVMELVEGVTLGQVLRERGQLPAEQAVGYVAQMLDGLAAAHAQGIVHRDVKPANVLVTRDGQVKVADFGVSRTDSAGTETLTQVGAVIGTPSYMSPEQCRGEVVDARADVFSAGVVLFELLAGRRPFTGGSAPEVWHKLMHVAPEDLRALCPEVAPGLVEVVERSLTKAPGERFAGAAAMAAALRREALAGDETRVMGVGVGSGLGAGQFDADVTATLARRLAAHVGPIAQRLVTSAISRSTSLDALIATLATSIEEPEGRQRFLVETGSILRGAPARSAALPKEAQEQVSRALAMHLGPVAGVLVRRHAVGCGSLGDLAERVAGFIEEESERKAFLRGFGRE